MQWVVISLGLWSALGFSTVHKAKVTKNLIEVPRCAGNVSPEEEKDQYFPVITDDPPVKSRAAPEEAKDGPILEKGNVELIDPTPDYEPTLKEINEK